MRTVLFINLHSRNASGYLDLVIERLRASKKFELVEVITIQKDGKLEAPLKKLKKIQKIECVIVGSGDGTINAVLDTLRQRNGIVYGFLPLGTGNAFVKSLGMSIDIEENLSHLEKAKPKSIALGELNGKYFANIAAIGMPVRVSKYISNTTKKFFGPLAYILSGAKHLLTHRAMLCTVTTEGSERSFYTHHVLFANGHFHGHKPISKLASVEKNNITIVIFGVRRSRLHYMYSMLLFELGLHKRARHIKLMTVKNARIETKPIRSVEIDGEVTGQTPVDLRVIPDAVKILSK